MPVKKTRNKFEKRIEKFLTKHKAKFKYESRKIPYVIAGHYNPDFELITPNGVVLVETKGYFRPEAKRKMVAVKKQHPELDIRILFYKYSKQNERWAIKNGFKYAFIDFPEAWLQGL